MKTEIKVTCVLLAFCFLSGMLLAGRAEAQMPGGWSRSRGIDQNARRIFNRAIGDLAGVKYTPLSYQVQVVNGRNYRFYCQTVTMGNPRTSGYAYVIVHVDPSGNIQDVTTQNVGTSRRRTGSPSGSYRGGSYYRSSPGSSSPGSSYPGSSYPGSNRRR